MEMSHTALGSYRPGRQGARQTRAACIGGWLPRCGGRVGEVGTLEGVTEADSVVWRFGLTIKGEHWVCSAGFKERQTEMSCNESPKKTPAF